jgi:probable HAF family extracellular repeat protein
MGGLAGAGAETAAGADPGPRYALLDLGALGGSYSVAFDINRTGHVVGGADGPRVETPFHHAFRFSNGAMQDLGPGGAAPRDSQAAAINASGAAVGWFYDSSFERHIFLHDDGGGFRDVSPAGVADAEALDINDSGRIVGVNNVTGEAIHYDGGTWSTLALTSGATTGRAEAINNNGQIAGSMRMPDGWSHAFRHEGGVTEDLGTLPNGKSSFAYAINDVGQVVGQADTGPPSFEQKPVLYEDGAWRDLGNPAGSLFTRPWDIDNCGRIVAETSPQTSEAVAAALYEDGAWTDLNSLLPAGSGWYVFNSTGINDAGQIAANAIAPNGDQRAVLLTPTNGLGNCLTMTATADNPTTEAGGTNGYTLEIENINAAEATVHSITNTLADGFAYRAGSSSGISTADPAVNGRSLTWAGPFTVPAQGSLSLHFEVTVGTAEGEFFTSATADADAVPVVPARNTASVTVTQAPQLRPVIFLPGIAGSSLRNQDGELWPRPRTLNDSASDDFLDPLRLAPDGRSPLFPTNPDYSTVIVNTNKGYDGVIDRAQGCLGVIGICRGPDIYKPTIEYLESQGYRLGETLFPIALDWRLSMRVNATRLNARIDQVLNDPDVAGRWNKVHILAHSQGGLVASALLSASQPVSAEALGKVVRVVTLGTPNVGTVKALGQLEYRRPCQVENEGKCILNPQKLQEIVTNFPGFLELLPANAYTRMVTHPLVAPNGRTLNWGDVVDERLGDRNEALIRRATNLHSQIDDWQARDPDVRLLRIVGHTKRTRRQIREYRRRGCGKPISKACQPRPTMEFKWGSGDGTVSLNSGDLCNRTNGFDLRGGAPNVYAPFEHLDLAQASAALARAVSFFRGEIDPEAQPCTRPPGPASAKSLGVAASADAGVATAALERSCADGPPALSDEPSLLAGTEIRTRGALTGLVVDEQGRAVGTDATGTWVADSPDSDFLAWDDTGSYFVGCAGGFDGSWRATEAGEIDFLFRTYAEDEVAEAAASPPIEVPAGALVSTSFTTPVDLDATVELAIDDNADGVVDRRVELEDPVQGDAADDLAAPTSTIHLDHYVRYGQRRVRATLAASDEGGSGIARIEWEAEALGSSGTYAEPLDLPACGELYVRAIDRAGNIEHEVKVATLDDRPGRRELVETFPAAPLWSYGVLECSADQDWFGLELHGGEHELELSGGAGTLMLALFDAEGNLIRETRSGELEVNVQTGRHYVRVSSAYPFPVNRSYALEVERDD